MKLQNQSMRPKTLRFASIAAILLLALALFLLWAAANRVTVEAPHPHYDADEDLVPTSEPGKEKNDSFTQRSKFTITDVPPPAPKTLRWRMGVGVPDSEPLLFNWPEQRPGWYLNWSANLEYQVWLGGLWTSVWMRADDARLGMEFAPMVRVYNGIPYPNPGVLRKLARQNPGRTWLVGNEPDVKWQDNATPQEYVEAYYQVYHAIKRGDPTAQVTIAGLSQITPLRLRYLEQIWTLYQARYGEPMPVDVWNMHAFVLREETNNWGVEIPPGFDDVQQGELWDIADHADLRLVEEQVLRMRRWMKDHGQQQKPLLITEYGILMPSSYGFPPSVVIQFMEESFTLFDSLRDPQLSYAADDHRLVQRWVWFSTYYNRYPAGNLFNGRGRANPPLRSLSRYLEERQPAN